MPILEQKVENLEYEGHVKLAFAKSSLSSLSVEQTDKEDGESMEDEGGDQAEQAALFLISSNLGVKGT